MGIGGKTGQDQDGVVTGGIEFAPAFPGQSKLCQFAATMHGEGLLEMKQLWLATVWHQRGALNVSILVTEYTANTLNFLKSQDTLSPTQRQGIVHESLPFGHLLLQCKNYREP